MSSCTICCENRNEFIPCMQCKHTVCNECFQQINKCPYCRAWYEGKSQVLDEDEDNNNELVFTISFILLSRVVYYITDYIIRIPIPYKMYMRKVLMYHVKINKEYITLHDVLSDIVSLEC